MKAFKMTDFTPDLKKPTSCLKILVLAAAVLSSSAGQAGYRAELFEQKSNLQKKLYTMSVQEVSPANPDETVTTYQDLEGNTVVEEKAKTMGSELVKTEIDHRQLKEKGIIEVKEGKAYFTKITADGKSSTKEEKIGKTFVVSATFQRFVRDHWDAIKKGEEVEFRYGVWDRQETVGFEVFKTGTEKIGEDEALVLKMKPSSFLIAALVKPIIFKFKADGSRLLRMDGRVPPKKADGKGWKDLDAEVVYSY